MATTASLKKMARSDETVRLLSRPLASFPLSDAHKLSLRPGSPPEPVLGVGVPLVLEHKPNSQRPSFANTLVNRSASGSASAPGLQMPSM